MNLNVWLVFFITLLLHSKSVKLFRKLCFPFENKLDRKYYELSWNYLFAAEHFSQKQLNIFEWRVTVNARCGFFARGTSNIKLNILCCNIGIHIQFLLSGKANHTILSKFTPQTKAIATQCTKVHPNIWWW